MLLRWLAVAGIALVVFLYYRPLRTYLRARDALASRSAEVHALAAEKLALERRLALSEGGVALVREARRLGLVKPGERLFIVRGISQWRRLHRATIEGHG